MDTSCYEDVGAPGLIPAVRCVNSTSGCLSVGGALGGEEGLAEEKSILVKGCGSAGWVMGNLFQEYWQHSSAETGRLRGLMDWEGFFILLYS